MPAKKQQEVKPPEETQEEKITELQEGEVLDIPS